MVMSVLQVVLDPTRKGMTMIIVTGGGVPSNSLPTRAMSASKSHYGDLRSPYVMLRPSLSAYTTEDWLDDSQYALRMILGLDPTRVTHPNRARCLWVRSSLFVQFGIRGSSSARGRLSVGHEGHWRASGFSVISRKARIPTRRKQGGPQRSRSRQELRRFARSVIVFCSVNAVVLPGSSVLKTLTSCLPKASREEVCIL
jgi:hypothetical protein